MVPPQSGPPLVSVVCPVFDTPAALLSAAVASVLAADASSETELLLVDDGSRRPETRAALAAATADPRVRLVGDGVNRGVAAARNAGIAAARGAWIGFIDADDLWRPGMMDRMRAAIAACPGAGWIAGGHSLLLPDGSQAPAPRVTEGFAGAARADGMAWLEGPALTRHLLGNSWLHPGSSLVRPELARRAGGFPPGIAYGEDWLFFVRLSTVTPLLAIPHDVYLLRRQYPSAMTSSRRLGRGYAAAPRAATRDPILAAFKREARWSLYATEKGLALNNLLVGRIIAGLGFALRAWSRDPREIRDLVRFVRLMLLPAADRARNGAAYSLAERFNDAAPVSPPAGAPARPPPTPPC